MGIYDRDYIRRGPPSRSAISSGIGRMAMWSVNSWLIIICVAVFVIDPFLPAQDVLMETHVNTKYKDTTTSEVNIVGNPPPPGRYGEWTKTYIHKLTQDVVRTDHYSRMPFLEAHLHFSTSRGFLGWQFWRFIGFQFLHSHYGISHLLFNMIGLYFFGSLVEQYLGRKRYLAFYLLCGIAGAFMYMLLNLAGVVASSMSIGPVPGLLFNSPSTPLIGASAGVYGVIMAGAFLAPSAIVLLFFILPMRLRTLAYGLVALAFFTLIVGGSNSGGEAGHLGGALAGFYFIRHPQHLHGFFDILGRVDPTSHHYRHGKARGGRPVGRPEGRGGGRGARGPATGNGPSDDEIDRILAKVSREGLQGLTDREKQILRRASDNRP